MYLKRLELSGFKSFARKTELVFTSPVTAVVGPNGSGKSNIAEAFRWVLGEQAPTSMRGKRGEDFIFNGSVETARLNHASVAIVFDNSKKIFAIDFDEVIVARHVYRDGVNEYFINQSKVRLKDLAELMAGVGLANASHYVISQGEADRLLMAGRVERLRMIEDALGLSLYQIKKLEAEKKLLKTEEHVREAQALRREIMPHLKYLRKQVEQAERVSGMKVELTSLYQQFFSEEILYLDSARDGLTRSRRDKEQQLQTFELERKQIETALVSPGVEEKQCAGELVSLERHERSTVNTIEEIERTSGRLEGMLASSKREQGQVQGQSVSPLRRCQTCGQVVTPQLYHDHLSAKLAEERERYRRLEEQRAEAEELLMQAKKELEETRERIKKLRDMLETAQVKNRNEDGRRYALASSSQELRGALQLLALESEKLAVEEADYKRSVSEAIALLGRPCLPAGKQATAMAGQAVTFAQRSPQQTSVSRAVQNDRRRQIERLKIRIEEIGGGSADTVKEFQELSEREQFLAREISDMEQTALKLRELMAGLEHDLQQQFKDGLVKINDAFDAYFRLLFGGGNAKVACNRLQKIRRGNNAETDEESQETEEGIDLEVGMPKKKLRGLQMLSGGERTLTSLALLFAISQVNPPPFLVLDETDAALDESNSKKYGEMLKKLALKSQLIIITHNRETMAHAGVLYGITMTKDAVSRVLSIKLDAASTLAAR